MQRSTTNVGPLILSRESRRWRAENFEVIIVYSTYSDAENVYSRPLTTDDNFDELVVRGRFNGKRSIPVFIDSRVCVV